MLDKVREESEHPMQNPKLFKIVGNKSFFAPPVKVYTMKKPLEKAYQADPALMRKVFDLADMHESTIDDGTFEDVVHELKRDDIRWTFRCLDRSHDIISIFINTFTDMFTCSSLEKNSNAYEALNSTTFKVVNCIPSLSPIKECQKLRSLTEGREWVEMSQEDRLRVIFAENDMIVTLYSKIHKEFSIKTETPDSCCTWALEKLAMVDVHPESTSSGIFITNTRDYLM